MKNNKSKGDLASLVLVAKISFSAIAPILTGLYLGRFLDKKLKINNTFAIILTILGAASGFLYMIKVSTGKTRGK